MLTPSAPILYWFAATVALTLGGTKWASLRADPQVDQRGAFLLTPLLSTETWRKRVPVTAHGVASILGRLTVFLGLALVMFSAYLKWVPRELPVVARSYLAALPCYAGFQAVSALLELIYLPLGWQIPAHLRLPFLSRSLDEFWGKRWATWVSDWFRQIVFRRHGTTKGMILVFVYSGLWHELANDLSLLVFYRESVMGFMLLYFLIQALGMVGERAIRRAPRQVRTIYAWTVIVAPCPLVINASILRALGL